MNNMFDENAEHRKFVFFRHSSVPGVNSFQMVGVKCGLIPDRLSEAATDVNNFAVTFLYKPCVQLENLELTHCSIQVMHIKTSFKLKIHLKSNIIIVTEDYKIK